MNTKRDPREIAEAILTRSICSVRVGCCIVDSRGRVVGWGWNGMGSDGYGIHAERHALSRTNKDRLGRATMYVAGVRARTGKIVGSRPCSACQGAIVAAGVGWVLYRDGKGDWVWL